MSGAGLWQFLIVCVELLLIGGLIFIGLDNLAIVDAGFKRIAKYGVGGALLLYFLFALGAVLGLTGGKGALSASPVGLLELAVAIIVLFVVIKIIEIVLSRLAPAGDTPFGAIVPTILYVVGAVAVIALVLVAAHVLGGGSMIPAGFHGR